MLSSCWCGSCNRGGTLFTQLEGFQEFLSEISQPKSGEHADNFPWRRHVHVAIHVLWAAQWSSSLSHPFHYWKNIWPQWLQKLAKWSSCFGLSMEKDWERKHSNEGVFLPDSKSDSLTGILPVSDILSGIMYSNVFYLTYFLAFYLIFYLTFFLALHIAFCFKHFLALSFAFYLAFLSDIFSGIQKNLTFNLTCIVSIVSDILSENLSDNRVWHSIWGPAQHRELVRHKVGSKPPKRARKVATCFGSGST